MTNHYAIDSSVNMELLIRHRAWWTASWTSLISPYIRKRQQTCWVRWKYYLTHCLLWSNYLLCYRCSKRRFTQNHQIILPNFLWEMAKSKSKNGRNKHSRTVGSWAACTAQESRARAQAPIWHPHSYKQGCFNFLDQSSPMIQFSVFIWR